MAFGLEDLEADLTRAEARNPDPQPTEAAAEPRDKKPHRALLPAHLLRIETVLPVPHARCPECGGTLHDAGAASNEMLDWIPTQVRVLRIIRPKGACRGCGSLFQAPAPKTATESEPRLKIQKLNFPQKWELAQDVTDASAGRSQE